MALLDAMNKKGKLYAEAPTTTPPPAADGGGGGGGAQAGGDTSLPDPTAAARIVLFVLAVLGVVAAIVANWRGWMTQAFDPAADKTLDFAAFAGFYVGAQVIERAAELVSPLVPFWGPPPGVTDPNAKVAHVKADRAAIMQGFTFCAGVVVSCAFGLYFLEAIGVASVSRTIDAVVTGLIISAGTKPLHDFITSVQNKNTPTTGTGTA